MWIILIILGVIAGTFILFKNKIKDFVTKKVQQKQQQNDEYVYTPVGLTRTFHITFTVEELGDGKAKIYIENKKSL